MGKPKEIKPNNIGSQANKTIATWRGLEQKSWAFGAGFQSQSNNNENRQTQKQYDSLNGTRLTNEATSCTTSATNRNMKLRTENQRRTRTVSKQCWAWPAIGKTRSTPNCTSCPQAASHNPQALLSSENQRGPNDSYWLPFEATKTKTKPPRQTKRWRPTLPNNTQPIATSTQALAGHKRMFASVQYFANPQTIIRHAQRTWQYLGGSPKRVALPLESPTGDQLNSIPSFHLRSISLGPLR